MTNKKSNPQKPKISSEFMDRLKHLKPGQTIQAIVILDLEPDSQASTKRQSPAERKAVIEATRQAAQPIVAEIDQILDRHEGKRLAAEVSALGSIPIETTVAGIRALVASEHVKSILEDQPISLLSKPKVQ